MPATNNISWASYGSSFATEMYLGSQRVWPSKYNFVSSSYMLGDNKIVYSTAGGTSGVPTYIQGKTRYISKAVNSHDLATLDDNTVVCWGSNSYGQLNVPSDIQGRVIKARGVATWSSLAILDDGTVRWWGRAGQSSGNIPAGLTGVIDLFGNAVFGGVIALKSDGSVVGWGGISIPTGLNRIIKAAVGSWTHAFQQDDGALIMSGYGSWTDISASAEIVDFAFFDDVTKFRTLRLNGDFWEHRSTNVGQPNRLLAQNIVAVAEDWPSVVLRNDGTILTV